MNKKTSISLNTFLGFFFVSFGYVAVQVLLTPIRIRLTTMILTKEQYAILGLVMMTTTFIPTIFTLGAHEYLQRKVPGNSKDYQKALYHLIVDFFGSLAIMLVIAGSALAMFFVQPNSVLGYADIVAIGLAFIFYTIYMFRVFFLLGCSDLIHFRMTQFMYSEIWFIPLVIASFLLELNITLILWIWVSWLFFTLFVSRHWAPLKPFTRPENFKVRISEVVAFTLPLLPMLFGENLFRIADRYLLLAFTDLETVALYSLSMNIALAMYMVGNNIVGLIVPQLNRVKNQLSEDMAERPWESFEMRNVFSTMLRYSLVFSIVGGAALFFYGEELLSVLSDPKFRGAAYLFAWAAPLSLFFLLQVVFSRTLLTLDKSRLVGGLTLICSMLNILFNLLLIPFYGAIGAVMATVMSLAVLSSISAYKLRAWRWINWGTLKPIALISSILFIAAGDAVIKNNVEHNLIVLLLAGLWGMATIYFLGLINKEDIHLFCEEGCMSSSGGAHAGRGIRD